MRPEKAIPPPLQNPHTGREGVVLGAAHHLKGDAIRVKPLELGGEKAIQYVSEAALWAER